MSAHIARIMVVDDDVATGKLLIYQLRSLGYDVVYLQDGLQALQRVLIEQPDLILLDVMMPHVNGWDVCREIRDCSTVPIIMLTGKDADDDVITGLRAGADDYVTKPFNMAQLQARVEAVLRRMPLRTLQPTGAPVVTQQQSRPAAPATPAPEAAARRIIAPATLSQTMPVVALAGAQAAAAPSAAPERPANRVGLLAGLRPEPKAPVAEAVVAPAEPLQRLGQRLRQARQERGLSLYQAERLCHVRWEYLQALEQENWEYAPRAQVRSALNAYAALLHVPLERYAYRRQSRALTIDAHQVVAVILTIMLFVALALLFL